MAKTKFQQELEKWSRGGLVRMCEGKGLDHTGDREALIVRLAAWEKAQSKESEPTVEPPAPESVVEPEAPEPED